MINIGSRAFMLALATLFFAPIAYGRTYVVCGIKDGEAGSLRAAIIQANRRPDYDVIYVIGPVHKLSLEGFEDDNPDTGDLDIVQGRLAIIGIGQNVTIDASALGNRIFHVLPGAQLVLRNLTLTGGRALDGLYASWEHENGDNGGAIYNAGDLSLQGCRLVGNKAGQGGSLMGNGRGGSGGEGGAIYNKGTLTMESCELVANGAGSGIRAGPGGDGGALCNTDSGICVARNCTFSQNYAGQEGGEDFEGYGASGGNGGGVYNSGRLLLHACTLSHNSSGPGDPGGPFVGWSRIDHDPAGDGGKGGSGGGVYNIGNLRLVLCTISQNLASRGGAGGSGTPPGNGGQSGHGGGIYNASIMSLKSCTVCFNASEPGVAGGSDTRMGTNAPSGADGLGGGLYTATGQSLLQNSIVAHNFRSGAPDLELLVAHGVDAYGPFVSGGHNLLGISNGIIGVTSGLNGDLAGDVYGRLDPLLSPLEANGGRTKTHALMPGSPAIDSGRSFGLSIDQRGHKRPRNLKEIQDTNGSDGADIGAFELQAVAR